MVPYVLRKHGVAVDRIAEMVAVSSIPQVCTFLIAPLTEVGLLRRTWILISAAVCAMCGAAAMLTPTSSLGLLTVLLFFANIAQSLGGGAAGALMTTVRSGSRGSAAGWYQAGNIGSGALAGGAMIWLADQTTLSTLALISALLIFCPALFVFRVRETPHPQSALGPGISGLFLDLREILWSRRALCGMAFFLSPTGAGALGNLISSVGADYHASSSVVAWITGASGGGLMALGALLGGWFCNRNSEMKCYAGFGVMTALPAMFLALGPATALTYSLGYSAYAFCIGLTYAAYSALILKVLGGGGRGTTTGFAFFSACGNVPLVYMTWLDGVGYRNWGAPGLMSADALLGGLAGAILFLLAPYLTKQVISSASR